jgi:glycosyltransferase involved in cell wall biosynthesis
VKIAFVTGWGVIPQNGGQGTFCAQLVINLAARGHVVSVLTRNKGSWRAWADSVSLNGNVTLEAPSVAALLKSDVVHLNGPSVRMLALTSLLRRPTVVTHEGYHLSCPGGVAWSPSGCSASLDRLGPCADCRWQSPLAHLHLQLQARLARRACHVAVSEHVRRCFNFSDVVLHPLDRSAVPDLSGKPIDRRVAFIGRLVPEKGPQIAVAALRELPGVELDVYGAGMLRPALEDQARELGVAGRVRFFGNRPSPVVAAAAAAAILIPGLWAEPLGYVTMEALAAGKAVIATTEGGTPELVTPERGWLVPAGDVHALAQAIDHVLGDPAERKRRGENGREFVRAALDPVRVAERYEEIYSRKIADQESAT